MKRTMMTVLALFAAASAFAQNFRLNDRDYYSNEGVDVMAFSDFYPEGHQGGISVLMHGHRVAANGDVRFEPTPGQWQPVPKQLSRNVEGGRIVTELCYPDSSRHDTGFNPMVYPDVQLKYRVILEPAGKGFMVTVDLDTPVPDELVGRAGFNLELFPGDLFGKPWVMDGKSGVFPQQPNAPVVVQKSYLDISTGDFRPAGAQDTDIAHLRDKGYSPYSADEIIAEPYARGRVFVLRPDDPYTMLTVKTLTGDISLYDGRMNHNNGWFVLHSDIPSGATAGAVKWYIEPNVVPGWMYGPVVQTSQVGYLPSQPKVAVIELDRRASALPEARLYRYDASGREFVKTVKVDPWEGDFLRYRYAKADFSDVKEAGLYCLGYGESMSPLFRIDDDVFDRGVWQPVIEYFLPVQMCHMRVAEKYRVWHDVCHMDDAQMAPAGNHIDGYAQPEESLTHHHPHDVVPGLNVGGWHDAGDFDLRVESQAGECYILTMAHECFNPHIDVTSIDHGRHEVEIHQPDGRDDILQQIENGALTIVNAYLSLGRFYRGIICNNLRQYVLLGDASAMTDGVTGTDDDRWVFTEDNPGRELRTAASLAAASRSLKGFNDSLSAHCLAISREVLASAPETGRLVLQKVQVAAELYLACGETQYLDYILDHWDACAASVGECGWYLARIEKMLEGQKKYRKQCAAFREALRAYAGDLEAQSSETPYGVPYRPSIWGAGWAIQSFGYRHYFLAKEYPDIFSSAQVLNALNFVLGCHPGTNQASFASGVGSQSATVGYGLNRADWSYIPGGVVSGTALIRPDYPELLTFPYLWQQVEYCLGGASTHYMFLVLAAKDLLD